MKHGIDKSILKGTVKIFDNTKTNMVEPDRDRLANGWQYQDKAFAEYFNFFWNETSSSLNQINPFILDFADEILQLKSFMVAEGMSASLFDPAQNNWFGKVGEYLSKAIKKEATDRASALQSLQNTVLGKIDEEKNARVQAVNKLTTDLEAEVKNRTDADSALKTSLEGKITAETNARNQLATTLRQEIATASTEDRKWANLTGKPSVFPTNWDNVSGKPSSFPSSWGSITGKPSSFPPSSHTHPISEVVNLQSELNMRVVGPEINLGTVTYNVASSSTYYLNTPPKYYQKTTLSLKVVKDVGGGYYWTSFNIYFPTGGRYKVISISARKVEVDPDAPHSFEISTNVSAGASYSGGTLVCSGKAYNKVNQVYGIMDIEYEKIL